MEHGEKGDRGLQGLRGERGEEGAHGERGATGERGFSVYRCSDHDNMRGDVATLLARVPVGLDDSLGRMETKVDALGLDVRDVKTMIRQDYVTKIEFLPVQRVVYGLVASVLIAVLTALITLVVRSR